MSTQKPEWITGYKETRNYIHNELGLSKDHIEAIIQKIVREEVKDAIGQNGEFIRQTMKEIMKEEMLQALKNENYPLVRSNITYYGKEKETFSEYMAAIIKNEVTEMLREGFDVGINIQEKKKGER